MSHCVGTIEYMPIHFMHQSVSFEELLALYAVSDVCIVASTRDGMNLVSFEYIACQNERHGSMILSEFAGSAQNLGGAIIINPWNIHDMARAMYQAVTMDDEERTQRFEQMNAYVQNNTRYGLLMSLDPKAVLTDIMQRFLGPVFRKGADTHRCRA